MAKRVREPSLSIHGSTPEDAPSATVEEAGHTPKYVELEEAALTRTESVFRCLLPPHKAMSFPTYSDYESHYNASHTNRCKQCRRNFPTSHFLQLHLSEKHDPIIAVKRERGDKTFACFLEDCDKVCIDWKKRRSHLVDKHHYPKNYDFLVVNNGIDGKWTMLRRGIDSDGHRKSSRARRASSATQATQMTDDTSASQETEETVPDELPMTQRSMDVTKARDEDPALEAVMKSMSSLQFVPRSVTFGKRKGKSGFAKS